MQNENELLGRVVEEQLKSHAMDNEAMESHNAAIEDIVCENVNKAAGAVVAVNMYITSQVRALKA